MTYFHCANLLQSLIVPIILSILHAKSVTLYLKHYNGAYFIWFQTNREKGVILRHDC